MLDCIEVAYCIECCMVDCTKVAQLECMVLNAALLDCTVLNAICWIVLKLHCWDVQYRMLLCWTILNVALLECIVLNVVCWRCIEVAM